MAVPGRKADDRLASTILHGSEDEQSLFCQPCVTDGHSRPAFGFCIDCDEHLCHACFTSHKKSKPCRNHKLLDKDAMPKSQKMSSAPQLDDKSVTLTTKCGKHSDEVIKYYCQDHKVILCSVCAMLEHRNCHINYIPDISRDIVDSKQYTEMIESMEDLLHQCQDIRTDTKRKTDLSNTTLSDALQDLRKFRQDMNKKMDKLEKNIENEANVLKKENANTLQSSVSTCEIVEKSVTSLRSTVKKLNTTKQAAELFIELQSAESIVSDHKHNITKVTQNQNVKEYEFTPNQRLYNIFVEEKYLGRLSQKSQSKTPSSGSTHEVLRENDKKQGVEEKQQAMKTPANISKYQGKHTGYSLSHVGDIMPQTPKDKSVCVIKGMAVTQDCLFLADTNNMSIKMLDLKSKVITSEIALLSTPLDITLVALNELAVTLSAERKIQFVSVSDKLSIAYSIALSGEGCGITCSQDKIAVTYESTPRLEIIDKKKGFVITTVKTRRNGKEIFEYPEYAASTSNAIFISDWGQKAVIQLNWHGHVLGKFSVSDKPQGIASTGEGTVYVSQFMTGNLIAISNDWIKGTVVVSKLGCLVGVAFCNRTRLLYLGTGYGESSCIKVFQCV